MAAGAWPEKQLEINTQLGIKKKQLLGVFNNSTCNADIQQQQHSANYVKSHANDLNNYSASQSFTVCPALNGLMNCIVQQEKN